MVCLYVGDSYCWSLVTILLHGSCTLVISMVSIILITYVLRRFCSVFK